MLEECADFECDPAAVALARGFVRRTLERWSLLRFAHDAEIVASELVTNAVLHARTLMRLTLSVMDDGGLRISVFDENPRLPTKAGVPGEATSGRGLFLVEQLATTWGVEQSAEGKVVWARLGAAPTEGQSDDDCVDLTGAANVDEALAAMERGDDTHTDHKP